ncbi:MAG TPA: DUF6680 family protein [Gammaproteobacteria bacterium]|nr:DUF6680 family protein [Gammaproteobacteria bacterium]
METYLGIFWQWVTYLWSEITTWLTTNNGIVTVIAILLAPIIALRVQTKLDAAKEKSQRKLIIFKTLIATYATRVSPDHIQALNMITIEFYGTESVLSSWRLYQQHLITPAPKANDTSIPIEEREKAAQQWLETGNDLFINLLVDMSNEVGFPFDKPTLSKGVYYPIAQEKIEIENRILREGLLKIICNREPLSMNVTGFPINQDALDKQNKLQDSLLEYYDGKKSVKVMIEEKNDASS